MTRHNSDKINAERTSRSRGKIARAVGNVASKVTAFVDKTAENMAGKEVPGSVEHLNAITHELELSGTPNGRLLTAEKYNSKLTDSPIAIAVGKDGSERRLTNVLFAGDSAIGVVTTQRSNGKYMKVSAVDFMLLPFGRNRFHESGQNLRPMANLAHIEMADMKGRFVDDALKQWEKVEINRTNTGDELVSRNHLTMFVDVNDTLSVINQSMSNPTYAMDGFSVIDTRKLSNKVGPTEDFMAYLNQDVHSWEPSPQARIIPGVQ